MAADVGGVTNAKRCESCEGHETPIAGQRLALQRIELPVSGLAGGGAGAPLARRIERLPGVHEVVVNPITGRAVVVFDPGVVGTEELVHCLEENEGIEVGRSLARWHLQVDGLTCGSCVQRIERAVERVPGVHGATVNVATSSLTVE